MNDSKLIALLKGLSELYPGNLKCAYLIISLLDKNPIREFSQKGLMEFISKIPDSNPYYIRYAPETIKLLIDLKIIKEVHHHDMGWYKLETEGELMGSIILTSRSFFTFIAPVIIGVILGIAVFFGKAMPVHTLLALPFILAIISNEIIIKMLWEPAEQLNERRSITEKIIYYFTILGMIVSSESFSFILSYLFCLLISKIF